LEEEKAKREIVLDTDGYTAGLAVLVFLILITVAVATGYRILHRLPEGKPLDRWEVGLAAFATLGAFWMAWHMAEKVARLMCATLGVSCLLGVVHYFVGPSWPLRVGSVLCNITAVILGVIWLVSWLREVRVRDV
jgi:hypothetical protein